MSYLEGRGDTQPEIHGRGTGNIFQELGELTPCATSGTQTASQIRAPPTKYGTTTTIQRVPRLLHKRACPYCDAFAGCRRQHAHGHARKAARPLHPYVARALVIIMCDDGGGLRPRLDDVCGVGHTWLDF